MRTHDFDFTGLWFHMALQRTLETYRCGGYRRAITELKTDSRTRY